ncbi:DUF3099 domain-containing protein [Paramicrobacterium agarici]|uniref:DUF3099 family protein n=1 Tax=Paramicrobacterium agarici TaxID=630514 RepID=A0A2A9DZ36_9MICO|nr:DUF3099 domain-containing protein [Microbacterium agarici]PFG31385.1 Protein of unknown function (DUF3099) [Microbacterium agarici]TQO21271.1 DUF3099 family protein [Microbacterium agarici]
MKKASITTLGMTPEQERHRRVIKYSVAMGVRMVCIVLMLFSHGWWLLVFAIGAIVLPYVAVVIANTPVRTHTELERPDGVVVIPQNRNDSPHEPRSSDDHKREAS